MSNPRPHAQPRHPEQGAILLTVLLVMLAILGVGMTALYLTSGNLQVSANMNLRTQALYVAEAGLDRARGILNSPTGPADSAALSALLVGSSGALDKVPTGLDASGNPNGVGAVLKEGATTLQNVSFPPASFGRTAGTADNPTATTMGSFTVYIRNDLAELRTAVVAGTPTTVDNNRTVVVRSEGIANDGRTTVVIEVTMLPSQFTITGGGEVAAGACYGGKNACDDNSNTQYSVTYGTP